MGGEEEEGLECERDVVRLYCGVLVGDLWWVG